MSKELLKLQPNVDGEDSSLLQAAQDKNKDRVEYLINAGANIDCTDGNNRTVLHYALENGWLEIVQSLLRKWDSNQLYNHGETLTILAVEKGHISIAKEIIQHLINDIYDLNTKSENGYFVISGLMRKVPSAFKLVIVRLLIQNGACLDSDYYKKVIDTASLKDYILKDSELCSRIVINEFNHKYLPKLYKLPLACKIPDRANMRITNNSQVAHEILQRVKQEIRAKGHCNVFKVPLEPLKVLCVKSFLVSCTNENRDSALNQNKRSAELNDTAHSSKIRRVI